MNILGLSFDYHDSAAALIKDGKIMAAAQEERFSRKKHDHSFPRQAIDFCLNQGGISSRDLDGVVYYENTLLKFDRIVTASLANYPESSTFFDQALNLWLKEGKFDVSERICQALDISADIVHFVNHHESHAASSFFCSPFQESVVITMDALGEYETLNISLGKGSTLEKQYSLSLPQSLGLFYSAFTSFLGFKVNSGEYKVMGMAGFGEPAFAETISQMIDKQQDGLFKIKQEFFDFLCPIDRLYNEKFISVLGTPRNKETEFLIVPKDADVEPGSLEESCRYYANIAASLQKCAEDIILHVVKTAIAKTGIRNVCMAGGVALNSLANGKLQKKIDCSLYIQPAAGDAGGALGAALYYYNSVLNQPRMAPFANIYLGKAYDDASIADELEKSNLLDYAVYFNTEDALINAVAKILKKGAVIGWMQGPFEWGPRALGNRSILANPMLNDIKDIVNRKIKFREPFRPFAPSVLVERAQEFFDLKVPSSLTAPEYFMLAVTDVKPDKREVIPGVTHVDGTARVHLVSQKNNAMYYRLIHAFGQLTGIPMLMNTSFNLRGEPIVNKPSDALKTFSWSDMDYVAMGRYLVGKQRVSEETNCG